LPINIPEKMIPIQRSSQESLRDLPVYDAKEQLLSGFSKLDKVPECRTCQHRRKWQFKAVLLGLVSSLLIILLLTFGLVLKKSKGC